MRESAEASRWLPVTPFRSECPPNSLIVARYSVLPNYRELEVELTRRGSRLLNTWAQHQEIADCLTWSGPGGALEGMTPRAYPDWSQLPSEGSWVLKGRTNSRKWNWNTHMFAPTTADIPTVARRLFEDKTLSDQGLAIRPYIPLRRLGEGLNGLPISNEWRTFWYAPPTRLPKLLARSYYWGEVFPETEEEASWPPEAEDFARRAASRFSRVAPFFVLDIAETSSGGWLVVEANDAQMSGAAESSWTDLYSNLSQAVTPSLGRIHNA